MTGRIVAVCAAVLAFLLTGQESFAQAVTDAAGAAKILERTDLVLIPANASFRWSLKVERAGEPTKEDRFLGFKKGDLKYLFYTYYPDSAFGQCHLRIDAAIWMYLPLADDTVKTSYKSAFLNSGLSYADVMYNELARYYDATLLDSGAKVSGLDAEYDCYKLELRARKGADGYARIVAYIDKARYLTVRRAYYGLSGQKLKEIAYGNFEFGPKTLRGFRLEIDDLLDPGKRRAPDFGRSRLPPKCPKSIFPSASRRPGSPWSRSIKP